MFDVDEFLAGPLTARVAAAGPSVRPTWYLWEKKAFWILTGPWARLAGLVRDSPSIAVTVDVCDVGTGLVRQVLARGEAEVLPFDVPRGQRLLSRYLGPDESKWDARFRSYLHDDPEVKGTVWVRMVPKRFVAEDLGYRV